MGAIVTVPQGFVIDQQTSVQQELPQGFQLDQPTQQPQAQFEAAGRKFSDPFGSRLGPAQQVRQREEQALADLRATAPKSAQFARDLPEIGEAPELNQMNLGALKSSLAAGLITNEAELANALTQLNPGTVIEQDPEGKALVKFPSGQSFAVNKPGLSGQDFVQFFTRLLAFAPSGRITGVAKGALAKGALAAGGTEAALQATEAGLGGEFDPGQVALAGGLQPAAQAIPSALGTISRALRPAPETELVRAGKDAGIPVLTSDIFEPETFAARTLRETGEKIPLIGTGELRAAQQKFREQALDDVAEKYGEFSYDAIIQSLKTQKDKIKKAAGAVLSNTEQKLDDVGRISLDNTNAAIVQVKSALTRPGVIVSDADRMAISEVDNLLTTLQGSDQIFSSLRQNRTAFREVVKGIDKSERSQLTSRAKGLLQSIESGMKKDLDNFAQGNLPANQFSKWQKANSVYAEEATKLTRTKLKNILDKGDVTPEAVKGMLFSRNPSETKILFNSLSKDGRKNARSAVISKIFDDLSKRQAGITPNTFEQELRKNALQIDTFFKGADKKQLQGLQKVLQATRRAQEASATTPTGQVLFGGGAGLAASIAPVETLLTLGSIAGTARLYESAPVRNALLRVAAAPAGQVDQAVQSALVAISQSLRGSELEQ